MTVVDDPVATPEGAEAEPLAAVSFLDDAGGPEGGPADDGSGAPEELWEPPPLLRPLLVAGLSSAAAAVMTGGIFGSWGARLLAVVSALAGVAWAFYVARTPARRMAKHLLLLPIVTAVSVALVAPGSAGESPLALIGKAIHSGRVLRPPVPFDPGWRPIVFVVFVMLGFAAGWVGTALRRPQMALVLPLPLLALTAITQPAEGQLLAGFLGLVPILAAVGVLFGGDAGGAPKLGRDFELKRLVRGALFGTAVVVVLVVLSTSASSIIFPKPAYNPAEKPQKPKAVPLSEAKDRVLFEVASVDGGDPPVTGPWVIGTLDVYDGTEWRLAPVDPRRLKSLGSDGTVDKTHPAEATVKFTVRDMGDSSTFPTVALPVKGEFPGQSVLFDPRTDTFRVRSGRIQANASYTMSMPKYPTSAQLQSVSTSVPAPMRQFLAVPKPPAAVRELLGTAPQNPWQRLDYVRSKLNAVVVATGAGSPGPVPPSKVQQLLAGNHEGTPFEIVAAEAMLARWAGIPARIGFGFDAGQKEGEVTTLRPKNAAQFLEVWFQGYGWIPVITQPPKAKTSLTPDKHQQFDPTIQPSDDVAVELVIPFELESLTQIYEKVRDVLLTLLPYALVALALYLSLPVVQKARRRAKRRGWAVDTGYAAQVAIEYAEFRDLTTDLSLGDPYDTPLQFLDRTIDDEEHEEFAWLVARVLYGDLRGVATEEDARAAIEMGESLRKRMTKGQPFQSRVLGVLSRASLAEPYTDEIPNVRLLKLRLPWRVRRGRKGRSVSWRTRASRAARAWTRTIVRTGGRA